jgi:hypothetical protein
MPTRRCLPRPCSSPLGTLPGTFPGTLPLPGTLLAVDVAVLSGLRMAKVMLIPS